MSKKIKDAYIQRYKLLEEQLPKLIDKYSVVKRLYIAGIAINAYLIYRNLKTFGVLRDAQNYVDKRQNEFMKVHNIERDRILEIMRSSK